MVIINSQLIITHIESFGIDGGGFRENVPFNDSFIYNHFEDYGTLFIIERSFKEAYPLMSLAK